jgi:antitoxin (DNA-binding transcriptional repressor) of toxin-antitoxin stability system
MTHLITVTEAVRTFADIIGRVFYRGEEYDIKKGNEIVAHLGPSKNRASISISELTHFFSTCPLMNDDIDDFEKDIAYIRSSQKELKSKWD